MNAYKRKNKNHYIEKLAQETIALNSVEVCAICTKAFLNRLEMELRRALCSGHRWHFMEWTFPLYRHMMTASRVSRGKEHSRKVVTLTIFIYTA